jgi:hypothetical protein
MTGAQRKHASPCFLALQDRALGFLEAGSTKVMRRLAVAHGFLQGIYHAPGKWGGKLVALLLSIPVFHACDLAFQISYALNQRRLRRVCSENLLLGVDDLLVKFDGLGLNLSHRMKAYESLRNIASYPQASDSRRDASHVHD